MENNPPCGLVELEGDKREADSHSKYQSHVPKFLAVSGISLPHLTCPAMSDGSLPHSLHGCHIRLRKHKERENVWYWWVEWLCCCPGEGSGHRGREPQAMAAWVWGRQVQRERERVLTNLVADSNKYCPLFGRESLAWLATVIISFINLFPSLSLPQIPKKLTYFSSILNSHLGLHAGGSMFPLFHFPFFPTFPYASLDKTNGVTLIQYFRISLMWTSLWKCLTYGQISGAVLITAECLYFVHLNANTLLLTIA